jgi:hypothetical protein
MDITSFGSGYYFQKPCYVDSPDAYFEKRLIKSLFNGSKSKHRFLMDYDLNFDPIENNKKIFIDPLFGMLIPVKTQKSQLVRKGIRFSLKDEKYVDLKPLGRSDVKDIYIGYEFNQILYISIGGKYIITDHHEKLAKMLGFESYESFFEFVISRMRQKDANCLEWEVLLLSGNFIKELLK